MKDTDHHMRHPCGHLGDRANALRTRGCRWRDDQFGRAQNTVLGWSDPTLAQGSVPKVTRGSLQPNKKLLSMRAVRIWAKQGEEGRNYALQLRLQHLLLLVIRLSLAKTRK